MNSSAFEIGSLAFFAVIIAGLIFYFLPCIIAFSRHHHQSGAVFAINLFLGWTLIGWVVALAMSMSAKRVPLVVIDHGDIESEEVSYRRADERGSADGAFRLGVLLYNKHADTEGAEAAYRRADERGSANGANNLGVLLYKRGDTEGAEAAFRRADERGNADSANNLSVLLKGSGDAEGAGDALIGKR